MSIQNTYQARMTSPNVTSSCITRIVNTLRMNWLRTATDCIPMYVLSDCFSTSYIIRFSNQSIFEREGISQIVLVSNRSVRTSIITRKSFSVDNNVNRTLKECFQQSSMKSVFVLFLVVTCAVAFVIHSDKDYEFKHTKAQFGVDYLNSCTSVRGI